MHWGNKESWSEGCLLANPNDPSVDSDKKVNNTIDESKSFTLEIVKYVKKREEEIRKEYNIKTVEKIIIITQDNEKTE